MKDRFLHRLRKHPDYQAVARTLAELGLEHSVEAPRGRGHPIVRIGSVRFPISSTPSSRTNVVAIRAQLLRRLRDAGILARQDV